MHKSQVAMGPRSVGAMKSRIASLVIGAAAVFAGGCATIVHSGLRSIPVASDPPGAQVTIFNRDNEAITTQTTPFVAELQPKYGYFKGQNYRLVFNMPGYTSAEAKLTSSVSGWYFGNVVFGGLIGLLIVDPLTGAMYNLQPAKIEQPMSAEQARILRNGNGLMVILVSQATQSERLSMVRVN